MQESSDLASGRKQPACYYSPFSDVPDNIIQNQPGPDLVLADCARFSPNGSGPEASQCTRIIRPASGQCFPADPARMRIGCGMFTGIVYEFFYNSKITDTYQVENKQNA